MGKHKEKSHKRKHVEDESSDEDSGALACVILNIFGDTLDGDTTELVSKRIPSHAEEEVKKHKDKKAKKHKKENKSKKDDEEKQLLKAAKKFLKNSEPKAPHTSVKRAPSGYSCAINHT